MPAKLYSLRLSHPAHAARLMLARKGIRHEVRELPAGFHPLIVRFAGFDGDTVPALDLGGRRVQGSRQISAALDALQPEPALFPSDPERRRAVSEAEEWGERVLQPVPRRLVRWGVKTSLPMRRWLAGVEQMPAPGLMARAAALQAAYFARVSGADEAAVRTDLAQLPTLLDEVGELIDAGTIGRPEPNAADFQIGTTIRLLAAFDDLRDSVEPTPAGALGMRVMPRFDYRIPAFLPETWLPASPGSA